MLDCHDEDEHEHEDEHKHDHMQERQVSEQKPHALVYHCDRDICS